MTQKDRPVDEVRIGRIKAAIWRNDNPTGDGVLYNVTLTRLYNGGGGSGDWHTSSSLGRDDLLLAAKVLDLAHTRIYELQAADAEREPAVA